MKKEKTSLYVEVDGVSYPAEVSLGAMLLFKKETGKEISEINGLSDTIVWLWCCVKSASSLTSNPLEMKCDEFASRCTMETLEAWTEAQNSEESKKRLRRGAERYL